MKLAFAQRPEVRSRRAVSPSPTCADTPWRSLRWALLPARESAGIRPAPSPSPQALRPWRSDSCWHREAHCPGWLWGSCWAWASAATGRKHVCPSWAGRNLEASCRECGQQWSAVARAGSGKGPSGLGSRAILLPRQREAKRTAHTPSGQERALRGQGRRGLEGQAPSRAGGGAACWPLRRAGGCLD